MDSKKLEDCSLEELEALLLVEQTAADEHKKKVRAIKRLRDVAFERLEVVRKVSNLSPAGLTALAQVIGPEGMASLTKFGVPGGTVEKAPKSE